MKLKHVFFSSLLLSVGFTACTNDDFTEISAPVNTSEAIALGENFTIKVGKGATTRAAFDKEEGAFIPYWEEGDKLGAAWVHKVIALDEDDNTIVAEVGTIGSAYKGFYSNSPLALTEGAGTNDGTFATVDEANLFAGAYVLYYPYDKTVSMQGEEIPVAIKSYEFDAANPLKNVSDNMFSYSPVKFVPGGNQTAEFTLKQVPVLFRLRFTPAEELNMDLSDGITINHIVVEARKSGSDVLVEEGAIETATEPTKADYNAPAEDEALADIVKYAGGSTVDHLFITTKGTDNDNYKMLVKSEPTKEEFAFSIMPFTKEADEIVIKVVTDKGTYAKTYEASIPEDAAYIAEFKKAAKEGEVVRVNVVLDVTDPDYVIYTAEEFVDRWDDAIAAGKQVELQIGTPLTLTDELVCNNTTADVKVTGDKLTVPSMNLQTTSKNGIEFENAVVVEGKLFTTGNAKLTTTDLTAETVEIQGDANLTVAEVKEMSIATSGVVTVAGKDTESTIGKIVNRGQLTPDVTKLTIESLDSADGSLAFRSNFTNKGTMTLGNTTVPVGVSFNNEGTVYLKGTFTGSFNNKAGAILNIQNANVEPSTNILTINKMSLTNEAANVATNKDAAEVNIGKYVVVATETTNAEITNNGIIKVAGTLTETTDQDLEQNAGGEIIVTDKDAVINLINTTPLNGYVVILNDNNVPSTVTNEPIAYSLTATTGVTVPSKATTIFVNCAVKASDLKTTLSLTAKDLVFYNNITLDEALTLTGDFTVAGNVTVNNSTDDGELALTLKSDKANKIAKGATLSLSKNVKLTADNSTTLTVEGEFKKGEGTVDTSVTLDY